MFAWSLTGCGGNGSDGKASKDAKPGKDGKPGLVRKDGSSIKALGTGKTYKITARDYYNEFEKDEDATQSKYAGAEIELTAKVQMVQMSEIDPGVFKPAIMLVAAPKEGKSFSTDFMHCIMKEPEPWKKIGPKGMLTVKCRLDTETFALVPVFNEGEIVSYEGDLYEFATAEALAKAYAADKDAFVEKYDDKQVIVTGVVESTSKATEDDNAGLVLKGADGVNLSFTWGSLFDSDYGTAKTGDTITVVLELLSFSSTDTTISYTPEGRLK